MPNGTGTYATKEGTITIGDKLILKHVLFVPNLNYNLISVSQLQSEVQIRLQRLLKMRNGEMP
jgi:hypothetical protein